MTTAQDIKTRIIELVAEHAERPVGQILPEHSFINDLAFDSLATVEFVMSLEDEFELSVPDEEVHKLKTVGDVIELVTRQRATAT